MKQRLNINKSLILFLAVTVLIVFIFYFRTAFYEVKAFDELVPFKETLLPVCFSFSEVFELISLLGLKQHFEAMNTLYSNIVSLRCNPFGNLLQMLIQVLFKKNPVNYHLYSLSLHLINTALVFLIIRRACVIASPSARNDNIGLFLTSLLTLLWSLHPVNIESVLLLTNANILLSYTFTFLTIFIYLTTYIKNPSFIKALVLFFTFSFALFTTEFHFVLPLILIAYTATLNIKKSVLKLSIPLIAASILFALLFLCSNIGINLIIQSSIELTLERIFWLSPQILFHFTKIIFLPINLSIDQTMLVKLGKSIFDSYSIFCIGFIVLILLFSLRSFLLTKKGFPFFFVTFFLYLLSLFPFSQIPAPLYNLASERYLYFPSFILIFGLAHFLFHLVSKSHGRDVARYSSTFVVACLLFSFATRAYFRTLDWKDSISLYSSAIKTSNDPLHKAFRYKGLTPQEKIFAKHPEKEVSSEHRQLAINHLQEAISSLKKEKKLYQATVPNIVKHYGLDPASRLLRARYYLIHTDLAVTGDHKKALQSLKPYVKDLSLLDSTTLQFYGSELLINNELDEVEKVLRYANEKYPHSLRIILPLSDVIQTKYGDLEEVKKLFLEAFKYFPYDTFTLFILPKIYELTMEQEKYALYSYIYGLRHHSIKDLQNAYNTYLVLNKKDKAEKAKQRIIELAKHLNIN